MVELLAVLATIAVLPFMMLPRLSSVKVKASRIKCVSNLKQVGLAFRIFAGDNNDKYPFAATNNPAFNNTSNAWLHFQAMSNELASAKILMCPADRNRLNSAATDFLGTAQSLSDASKRTLAISYFVGTGAAETRPKSILTGDRNIAPDETSGSYSGYYVFGPIALGGATQVAITADTPAWSNNATNALHNLQGNIVLGDASVHQVTGQKLRDQLNAAVNAYSGRINTILVQ